MDGTMLARQPNSGNEPRLRWDGRSAVLRRYRFKVYPTPAQAEAAHALRRQMVDLFNACRQRIEDVYRREGRFLSYIDLCYEITTLRAACPEWRAIPCNTARRVAKQLTDSYQAFFKQLKKRRKAGFDGDARAIAPPNWRRFDPAFGSIPLGALPGGGWQLTQREDNPLSWQLRFDALPGLIHARGAFPRAPDGPKSERMVPQRWRNADLIYEDSRWWLSVVVDLEPRRRAGAAPLTLDFNLVQHFVEVGGVAEAPEGMAELAAFDQDIDEMKRQRDLRWPWAERAKRTPEEREAFRRAAMAIRRLKAHERRFRNNALHNWTTKVITRASDLTILAPPIKKRTRTPRGDAKAWGASVEPVSQLNRHVLFAGPGQAILMLLYKASEAGIRCDVVDHPEPCVAVGGDLVVTAKVLRRMRRIVAAEAAE